MTDRAEPGVTPLRAALRAEMGWSDWEIGEFIAEYHLEDAATPRPGLVEALDPYVNLAEHGRQSNNGTHAFDPGCYFCLRLYWEDQQESALVSGTGEPGLDDLPGGRQAWIGEADANDKGADPTPEEPS